VSVVEAVFPAAAEIAIYVPITEIESVEADYEITGGEARNAFDGVHGRDNYWCTPYDSGSPGFPHWIQAKFKTPQRIAGLEYYLRALSEFSAISEYEILVSQSDSDNDFVSVHSGVFFPQSTNARTRNQQMAKTEFSPVTAKRVRLVLKSKTLYGAETEQNSVHASEFKFVLAPEPGAFDARINAALARLDDFIAYVSADSGASPHQYSATAAAPMIAAKDALSDLLGSGDSLAVSAALANVDSLIAEALSTGLEAGDEPLVEAPSAVTTAYASTFNVGNEPGLAIDGDLSTMWVCAWLPAAPPLPHFFTLDLGKPQVVAQLSITPRQDLGNAYISTGEVWVGDSEGDLRLLSVFT
jgi:hypothetical protein